MAVDGTAISGTRGENDMLRLVKVKNSAKWYIRGTVCGQGIYESTQLVEKALAEDYRDRREAEIKKAHASGTRTGIIFATAADMYMKSGGSDQYLEPIVRDIGKCKVDLLRQSDLDALALRLYPDVSNATRNRQAYTPFIAVMNYAASSDFCTYRKWRRPKAGEKVRKPRYATVEELAAICDAAVKRYAHIKRIAVLLAYTGLRMGEAIALQWEDVDLEKRWLIVRKSKTGKGRGVPLHKAVVRELEVVEVKKGSVLKPFRKSSRGYIRNYRGGNVARKARDTVLTNAKVAKLTWHDFRHTCATWLQMAGIDRETRQDILGHSRKAVHDTYIHVPEKGLIDAIDKLPDFTDISRGS